MRNKIFILGALLLTLAFSGCRDEADLQYNYSVNDNTLFAEAQNSFAGKYRVFWNAMNSNYGLWDYEKEFGLDWDEHYEQFLPKFEALDASTEAVTDSMLQALMNEMVAPLHDGHFAVTFINHQTQKPVMAIPSALRNATRDDITISERYKPNLTRFYYNGELKEYKEADTRFATLLAEMTIVKGRGLMWAEDRYNTLTQKEMPTQAEAMEMKGLKEFIDAMENFLDKGGSASDFNEIAQKYSYLNIPFLEPINVGFEKDGISVKYGLFNDNIAYFYLSDFNLIGHMDERAIKQSFPGATDFTYERIARVVDVWKSWFSTIQAFHKAGQLKGIILDLRGNGGGALTDEQYLLGGMLPAGGFQIGWSRLKRGVGRYDYSPMMPESVPTMEADHEIITDVPIVVLVNSGSVSMSEITALTAKNMPNARVIGKRTHGGLCGLTGNEFYTENYAGHIGVEGATPVFCYLPNQILFDNNKRPLESIGIIPDFEVDLDTIAFKRDFTDTQLNRALQYVRTGN